MLREKITAGMKRGMSAGMTAHQIWGFVVRKAAATSMATTEPMRKAILRAQDLGGSNCIDNMSSHNVIVTNSGVLLGFASA
jgi:hypothetical protein